MTDNLDPGLDTVLFIYDTQGNQITSNDDYEFGNRGSLVEFTAPSEGFYFARVINQEPTDPTNKKYCFDVTEIQGPTPIPTGTRVPGADVAEWNGSIETAYLIGPTTTYQMNFVPLIDEGPDNDFFRIWVKAGLFYTCETLNLSSVNDTNMILYDSNGNAFNPPIGNDDKELGNFGSKVSYFATYTGWLHILVGPHAAPEYGLSHLYTYDLRCEQLAVTPTPVATATRTPAPVPPGGGGGPSIPTATRTPTVGALTPSPTFPPIGPTPTEFMTPTPTATPAVIILPLPTPTPVTGGQQTVSLNITLYYDANNNFTAELTEGVMDVAIALYDNATNQLLAFGYTNEAGQIHFDAITSSGPIRISVPFLNYSQLVVGVNANIFIRIPPGALPIGIP